MMVFANEYARFPYVTTTVFRWSREDLRDFYFAIFHIFPSLVANNISNYSYFDLVPRKEMRTIN